MEMPRNRPGVSDGEAAAINRVFCTGGRRVRQDPGCDAKASLMRREENRRCRQQRIVRRSVTSASRSATRPAWGDRARGRSSARIPRAGQRCRPARARSSSARSHSGPTGSPSGGTRLTARRRAGGEVIAVDTIDLARCRPARAVHRAGPGEAGPRRARREAAGGRAGPGPAPARLVPGDTGGVRSRRGPRGRVPRRLGRREPRARRHLRDDAAGSDRQFRHAGSSSTSSSATRIARRPGCGWRSAAAARSGRSR